jgi:hypothetical protein
LKNKVIFLYLFNVLTFLPTAFNRLVPVIMDKIQI